MKSHQIKNTFKFSHTVENSTIPDLPKQAELARPLLATPLSVRDQFSQIVMQGNRCFVICLGFEHDVVARSGRMSEMTALLVNLGDTVCGCTTHYARTPNPKTLLGQGKLMEFAEQARQVGATVLVIDAPLSPAQARNIESMTGLAVRDRSATILSVFAQHARTKSARVQIEIAQLQYLKPRIRRIGVSMDQQVGGINAGKGPGETASQLLVRQLDKRLSQLLKSAQKLKKIGATQRQGRKACRQISLVGYTNAGKTSLMNMLTHAELSARDMPFETLDTTTRVLSRQAGSEILLSDTVGFIRDLPTALLASFESTLAQVGEADLMLVVIDLSDPEWLLHLETTRSILEKLSLLALPIHYVLNKVDLLTSAECDQRCVRFLQLMPDTVFTCVNTECPVSVDNLKRKVIERVTCTRKRTRLFVRHGASKVLAEIYAQCTIVAQEANAEGTLFIVDARVI